MFLMCFGVQIMSFNKIMTFFAITTPICVVMRIIQIIFAIDFESGFYNIGYEKTGNLIMGIILVVAASLAIFCFNAYRSPEKLPAVNRPRFIGCFGLAVSLVFEALIEEYPVFMLGWQITLIKILGFVAALYFVALILGVFDKTQVSQMFHIVPVIYFIARIVFTFINISTLALISDNILLLAAYCLVLLFFCDYSKIYNQVSNDKTFRRILAFGLTGSMLCFIQSISYIVVNFFMGKNYTHTDFNANIVLLFSGIFILTFIISYFKNYNRRFK